MSEGLPDGWKSMRLGAVGKFSKGKGIAKKDIVSIGMPCIRYAEIYTDYDFVIKKFNSFITPDLAQVSKKMIKNDIIFAGSGETIEDIGKSVAFVDDFDAYVGGDAIVLSPSIKIDSVFLSYELNDNTRREQLRKLGQGSSVIHIYSSGLEELFVQLPTYPEQKKIAKILTSVDEVIETTETQINKLKDLKKGMMNALLTQGIGHTEFKDSSVGRIPVGWDVKKLANVINSIESGVSVNSENRQKFINESGILKTSAVSGGNFFPLEHKAINSDELDRAKCNPRKDTIIVSRMNTPLLVGESGYVDKEYDDIYLPDRLWMLNIADKEKVHVKWLSYMLSYGYMRNKISDAATGTSGSMKNISKPNFLAIKVTLPSIQEQQKIASILTSFDNTIEQKQSKLTQTKNLKKSLMADLLTGKVRVTP